MVLKTLTIGKNLREEISYSNYSLPLSVCIDNFDDYFQREWECHWHDELEFGILQKGSAQFTVYNGKEHIAHVLYPGDGIFINSGCLHSAKALAPNTVIAEFVLSASFLSQLLENVTVQHYTPASHASVTSCILHKSDAENQSLLACMEELCSIPEQEADSILHFIELVCRIWRLLTLHISGTAKDIPASPLNHVQENRLKQMLSYIHSHYNEQVSVENIAASAAVSRTECFRCFRMILEKTPVAYLEEYRLAMSTALLSNMSLTVSDISLMCGFNSTSYFCKLFRKRYGIPPQKYRQQQASSSR